MDPKRIQDFFYGFQIVFGIAFIAAAWFLLKPRSPESQFREPELKSGPVGPQKKLPTAQDLAHAKMKRNEPLQLSGIRIDGAPHEILGVKANANAQEIQHAYRELMKRYHPDKVGRQGSREWQDAQRIAEALNQAKATLLKNKA